MKKTTLKDYVVQYQWYLPPRLKNPLGLEAFIELIDYKETTDEND